MNQIIENSAVGVIHHGLRILTETGHLTQKDRVDISELLKERMSSEKGSKEPSEHIWPEEQIALDLEGVRFE